MAINEGSTGNADREDAVAPSGQAALGEPGKPFLRRLAGPAVAAALFVLAWLGSSYLQDQAKHEQEDDNSLIEVKNLSKTTTAVTGGPLELLTRGDLALRQHRFAQAISLYDELRATSAEHGPLIDYRLALCQESIGQLAKAIAGYRATLSGPYLPPLLYACHLGLARCLFRQGQYADTRRLLYPFLLDESRQQGVPRVFVADTRYLIALSLSREAVDTKSEHEDPLSISSVGLETPFYLDEVGAGAKLPAEPAADEAGKKADDTDKKADDTGKKTDNVAKKAAPRKELVVKKKTDTHPLVVVQEMELQRRAVGMFDLLAAESGTTIQLSAGAKMSLADRSLRLSLRNWLLDDLLEPMAEYFDLICLVEGDVHHISTSVEIEANKLKTWQRDRAGRALRGVLLAQAGHPLAAAACLELGNWETAQDKLLEAAAWFERLVRESPNSPYVPPAYFNLALLHLRKLDVAAARAAFFHVVDQAPGHELALKAYVRIGQSYLEEDDVKEGIIHLKHALSTAPNSPYHGHAIVALAAGYLLNNQPDKARIVLAKERALLQKDTAKATAAFLDAYAQLQLAKESSPGRREASDLLSTLWRDEDRTVLGPLGDYLIAQAYRDLGFWSHAEKLLGLASKKAHGTLEKAVEFSLADTLLKQQRRKDAERLFMKVASTPSPYRARARFQLAHIRLLDKQFKECAALCRELWSERSQIEPAELLHVWGTALEGMGEFAGAAKCFAGKAPD